MDGHYKSCHCDLGISLKIPRISCDEVVHTVQYHRENKQGIRVGHRNLFFRNAREALSKCQQAFLSPQSHCAVCTVLPSALPQASGASSWPPDRGSYVAGDLLQPARRPDRGMSGFFLYLDILKAMTVSMYMRQLMQPWWKQVVHLCVFEDKSAFIPALSHVYTSFHPDL